MVFVTVSAFLVTAIYSSSVPVVYANIICGYTGDGRTKFCTDSLHEHFYRCDQDDEGEWHCHRTSTALSNDLPPSLNDALDAAIKEDSQNTTKVPKGDFLNDGNLLTEGSQADNNTAACCCGDPGAPPCPKGPKDLGELNNGENGHEINPGLD